MGTKGLRSPLVCVSRAFVANHRALLPASAAAGSGWAEEGARDRAGSQEARAGA